MTADEPEPWPGVDEDRARRYVLLSAGSVVAGGLLYLAAAPPTDVLGVQFGGSSQTLPLPGEHGPALLWDVGFMLGYSVSLWTAARLARAAFRSRPGRAAALAAAPLGLVGVAADVVENVLLLRVVHSADPETLRPLLDWVTVAATVKFACLAAAAGIGYTAVIRTGGRLWPRRGRVLAAVPADGAARDR